MPKIRIESEGAARELTLSQAVINIGRSELCEVQLAAAGVSRLHARLLLEHGRILLEDMGSRNGTFYQEQRITQQILPPGQTFRIEQFLLSAELLPGEEALEPPLEIDRPAVAAADSASALYRSEDFQLHDLRRTIDSSALPEAGAGPAVAPAPKAAPAADLRRLLDLERGGAPAPGEQPAEEPAPPAVPAAGQTSFAQEKEGQDYPATVRSEVEEEPSRPLGETAAQIDVKTPPAAPPSLSLSVELPDGRRQQVAVLEYPFLIGRAPDCHLVLNHNSVSAEHALIERATNGALLLCDLQSTNGLYVNGQAITQTTLHGGEELELGAVRCRVELAAGEGAADTWSIPAQPAAATASWRGGAQRWLKGGFLAASAVVLILIAYQLFGNGRHKATPPAAPAPGTAPANSQETARLVAYNLDQALTLREAGQYEEALRKLNIILSTLQPNNEKALKLYNEIMIRREQEASKQAEQQRREQERQAALAALLAKGRAALSRLDYAAARQAAEEMLDLDRKSAPAKQLLLEIAATEKKKRLSQAAKLEQRRALGQKLEQGLLLIDQGAYAEGERLLREVIAAGKSEYQNRAKAALDKLEQTRLTRLRNLLSDAQIQYEDGNLAAADKLLRQILAQAPNYLEAKRLHKKIRKETLLRAEKLFNEARVMETTLEDTESALARYKELLALLPNPREPLHQKAQKRIKALQRRD